MYCDLMFRVMDGENIVFFTFTCRDKDEFIHDIKEFFLALKNNGEVLSEPAEDGTRVAFMADNVLDIVAWERAHNRIKVFKGTVLYEKDPLALPNLSLTIEK